jgi:hypothetical protein
MNEREGTDIRMIRPCNHQVDTVWGYYTIARLKQLNERCTGEDSRFQIPEKHLKSSIWNQLQAYHTPGARRKHIHISHLTRLSKSCSDSQIRLPFWLQNLLCGGVSRNCLKAIGNYIIKSRKPLSHVGPGFCPDAPAATGITIFARAEARGHMIKGHTSVYRHFVPLASKTRDLARNQM